MTGKARVIQLGLMLASTAILLVFVTFAWFATIEKTDPIIISTGSLKIDVRFFRGLDNNFDGVLDDVEDPFDEVEEELKFEKVIPGQIYTFKFIFKNLGSIDGMLDVTAIDILDDSDLLPYFQIFEKKVYSSSGDEIADFSEPKTYLYNNLLIDYNLESNTSVVFIFKIKILSTLTNSVTPRIIKIKHFLIKLEQEHK